MAFCDDYESVQYASWFSDVQQQPLMEQFYIQEQFKNDDYDFKIDLSFAAYRNEESKPWVFPVVRMAEKVLANDATLAKEYLHPLGYESFCRAAVNMLLGEDHPARIETRAFAVQTVSATCALRIGAEFLVGVLGITTFYGAEQHMAHTTAIFSKAGFKEFNEYRYYNCETQSLDIDSMLQDISEAKEGSVIYLQPCSHNPTGCDPTQSDWYRIALAIAQKRLFTFFECAYQGFVTGHLDQDVWAVRQFADRGIEFFCSQSFAKNFSLYSGRVGALTVVLNSPKKVNQVKSHFMTIIKTMYSSPPSHGARIVAFILGDKTLFDQLKDTLASVAKRLKQMRMYLREELERLGAPGTWVHITNQVGNFCFTGFNDIQVQHMKKQHHIYMLSSGRLTISGLNPDNVEYVAKSMNQTLQTIPPTYIAKHSNMCPFN